VPGAQRPPTPRARTKHERGPRTRPPAAHATYRRCGPGRDGVRAQVWAARQGGEGSALPTLAPAARTPLGGGRAARRRGQRRPRPETRARARVRAPRALAERVAQTRWPRAAGPAGLGPGAPPAARAGRARPRSAAPAPAAPRSGTPGRAPSPARSALPPRRTGPPRGPCWERHRPARPHHAARGAAATRSPWAYPAAPRATRLSSRGGRGPGQAAAGREMARGQRPADARTPDWTGAPRERSCPPRPAQREGTCPTPRWRAPSRDCRARRARGRGLGRRAAGPHRRGRRPSSAGLATSHPGRARPPSSSGRSARGRSAVLRACRWSRPRWAPPERHAPAAHP
jgi:hypothetical protein